MRGRGWAFGFDPFEFGWGGAGSGRRRRGPWFESGDMKYVILQMLRDKPMHGYEVMKALEERTHGCYKPSPGTVYPTLTWLEDEGLVRSEEAEGKKVYAITDAGREFLETHKSTVEDIFDRVTDTIDRLVREPMPDLNRNVGRVVTQAYRAAWRAGGGFGSRRGAGDDEKVRRVVEALDRCAKELEALS